MARTVAGLPAGSRITDYISLGVIAKFIPVDKVRQVLTDTKRGCQGRSKKEPPGRSKRGPLQAGQGARLFAFWGRRELQPCEAGGRALRAKRKPAPKRGRLAVLPSSYFVLSAARFCLLDFRR